MNIGIIIFVSVILKKKKMIFLHNYLRCCKIPKGYSSNSSNISGYINIVAIPVAIRIIAIPDQIFPEQKMLENDRMEIASKAVTSIRHRNDIEKSTWRTHRYFVNFESRIHVEICTSNPCHNFHLDSPFKMDEISTNILRGISTSNRWRINEDVPIGY